MANVSLILSLAALLAGPLSTTAKAVAQPPFKDGAATFEKVKKTLLTKYIDAKITEEDIYRAAVHGMLSQLDPDMSDWNTLLSPSEYDALIADTTGEIAGIGVEIIFDKKTGR